MIQLEFEKLLKKDKYQVFLFTCSAWMPLSFAKHPWFVINKKGIVSRWEIEFRKDCSCQNHWGHLHKDFLPPTQGIEVFPYLKILFWKSKLINLIEGDENSLAQKVAEFIENSKENYPHCYKYSLLGPNSNTYIQYILNKFPKWKIKLPWNCFGKNYKNKKLV